MGHRANLVLVENKEPIIYYTGRRAQETPNILAQGLNFCEKYFSEFDEVGWLMDNAFAEGGILIDKDNKKILIFGGGDISYTPALQRLYCKHITKIWKGWNVEWCSKGNVDFKKKKVGNENFESNKVSKSKDTLENDLSENNKNLSENNENLLKNNEEFSEKIKSLDDVNNKLLENE